VFVLLQISIYASLLLGLLYMFIAGVAQVVGPNRRFTLKVNSSVLDYFIGLTESGISYGIL
jgi:hypothetical protein